MMDDIRIKTWKLCFCYLIKSIQVSIHCLETAQSDSACGTPELSLTSLFAFILSCSLCDCASLDPKYLGKSEGNSDGFWLS